MAIRQGRFYSIVIATMAGSCVDLIASSASAQALTLEQAVEIATEQAPQIQMQRARLEGAQALSVAAGRLPDPELILGIDNLPVTGDDAWSTSQDFMTMRKVGVMQTFPSSRKRTAQSERAAALVSVAQRQAQQTRLETARDAALAWVSVYALQLTVDQLRTLQPEVQLQASAARAALASGRGSTVDALAAQAEISELEDRLLVSEREALAARAELGRWIGDAAQRPLADEAAFDVLPAPREQLLASVHRHAPLLTYEAQRSLAESDIELAKAEKRSDWSAELSYAKRGDAFSDMISLDFRVGLPLFSRYRQDPIISSRRAELAQLDAEREAGLRMHAAETESALGAWETARKRIAIYREERLPLARQRSQAALAGFRTGQNDLATLLASHVAELDVQRSYAELVKELGDAWVFLRYVQAEGETP